MVVAHAVFCSLAASWCWDVSAAESAQAPATNGNEVIRRIPFKVHQGVAVDAQYFYAISNTEIVKCDRKSAATVAVWRANRGEPTLAHFLHLNSGTVIDGKLYCAHSRYPVDANNNTIEVWDVQQDRLDHERTIRMPTDHGSVTWIDRRGDGSWWICYAVYGKGLNERTKLFRCRYVDGRFVEEKAWTFPLEVVRNWGESSCSGGSWGPDGYLYTTGHDHARCYVLHVGESDQLTYVRTETNVGLYGQAIAWDRWSDVPVLWGIVRGKEINLTLIPRTKTRVE